MCTIEDCNGLVKWYLAPRLKAIELCDTQVIWYWTRMLFKTKEEIL